MVHIFTDFGNAELGQQVRQAHRQNYRRLAIQYPDIEVVPIFVYPEDDKAYGHDDVYKLDFWTYPWPQGLVKKLANFERDEPVQKFHNFFNLIIKGVTIFKYEL